MADYCRLIGAGCEWAGGRDGGTHRGILGTDLGDAWVGALDVLAGQVEPAGGVGVDGGAVVPQGAASLAAAPAALELPLGLQTHATAVTLSRTLVQVHCGMWETDSKRPREVLGGYCAGGEYTAHWLL